MVKKIVILCGPRDEYGYCPVPPLTDSAPEKNIFRLVENDYGQDLEITVISACSNAQVSQLNTRSVRGSYTNIPFPEFALEINRSGLFNLGVVHGFCNLVLNTHDLFTWAYLTKAAGAIKAIDPDIIFINSLPQYVRFLRKRFPRKKLGLFQRGEMGVSRKHLHLLDCIITNSRGITDYVRQLLDGADVAVSEIPNTLEESYCLERKIYSNQTLPHVIFAGRITADKGVFELLSAFERVQEQWPGAHLKIVGGNFNGNELSDFETYLVRYSVENKLNVDFVGRVPNAELSRYYLGADVAVFPSLCLESFGMVALEAMRCGLPVIASRRPGFEELIVPGETGLIVDDPEDIQALAGAILSILNNPKLARSMGEKGYQRSLAYTPRAAAARFKVILQETLLDV